MGGAVAIKVHLKEPREWDGLVLVAPMCKVSRYFNIHIDVDRADIQRLDCLGLQVIIIKIQDVHRAANQY